MAPGAKSSSGTTTAKKFVPITSSTALSAMIVQAAAQISNARSGTLNKGSAPETVPANTPDKDASKNLASSPDSTASTSLNLSDLIAQMAMLVSTGPQIPVNKDAKTSEIATNASEGGGGKTATSIAEASGASDLSTLLSKAAISSTNAAQVSSTTSKDGVAPAATIAMIEGKDIPSTNASPVIIGSQTKEKKSTLSNGEGTFIQSGTSGSSALSSMLNMLSSAVTGPNQSADQQTVTTNSSSKGSSLESLAGAAAGPAGTANVEKGKDMNALLNFPEIFSGSGTSTVSEHTPVNMHIQLSTNNDFEDALKQVMHVAQLTQTNESRTPMRVAIEIQTPPGAIVNVYVSRQNDQWRAQLSTSDVQALTWVQDKMSSLRQSDDIGVDVKWLPPQIETISTSASSESNLGWDRGSQSQQNFQQEQEDRQQTARQKRAEVFAGIGSGQFMETLTTVGSAA
jgi:hypothetical protein